MHLFALQELYCTANPVKLQTQNKQFTTLGYSEAFAQSWRRNCGTYSQETNISYISTQTV